MKWNPLTLHKLGWTALAGLSVVYCVAALAYIAVSSEVRVHCLLNNANDDPLAEGLEIRSTKGLGAARSISPAPGDFLISLGGWRIHSFIDLTRAAAELQSRHLTSAETWMAGTNPSEHPDDFRDSSISLLKLEPGPKLALTEFRRGDELLDTWLPLEPQETFGIAVSIVWFVLQSGVLLVAGFAHWRRPYDRALRLFFIAAIVAQVAFIGGSHWWVISRSLILLLPFVMAAILLPAVLLHFFLHYPAPRRWLQQQGTLVLAAVYAVPTTAALGTVAVIVVGAAVSGESTTHAFGRLYDRLQGEWVQHLLRGLRTGILAYLIVSTAYFLLSLGLLVYSFVRSRQRSEHEQVRWILVAAAAAVAPLGYALWLAFFRRVDAAYGGAQLPLFVASLMFTVAYAVGIVRHRLMLIDQVLNRGVLYYLVTLALTIIASMALAYGAKSTLQVEVGGAGQPALAFVVATLAVMLLLWFRDWLQRGVDREFFREKYQLDKTLQRFDAAVTNLLDRQSLAERVLTACQDVLQSNRGAIYLRDDQSRLFYRTARLGDGSFPAEFVAPREFVEALRSGLTLQQLRSGSAAPIQNAMRVLDAELVHGLDVDGALAGMLVLGAKPNGASYTAEDAAFLTALGRMAGVTLHFGRVHEQLTSARSQVDDVQRLNSDLIRVNDELTQRLAVADVWRTELQLKEESLGQSRRQIDALQAQLRLNRPAESRGGEREFAAPSILGTGGPMRQVLETVRKVAPTEASVLVRGESGTGKELLARAIHDNSPRRSGPLVTIHCAALAPGVLESELFGHVRGAFTDARQDKQGRFQLANTGTLFLDEIGDVPLETQVKLLRVLQERVIEPVGSAQPIPVDVRLIAATHRNLEEFIAAGRFREDLYYRLNVVSITLPPLRERSEDIVELAVQFLRRAAQKTGKPVSHFDEAALERLRQYAWPGNVRELENVVERAVVLAETERIDVEDLPPAVRTRMVVPRREVARAADAWEAQAAPRPVSGLLAAATDARHLTAEAGGVAVAGSDEERQLLREALTQSGGNKAHAARLLHMPRSTLFSKLRKHGLD